VTQFSEPDPSLDGHGRDAHELDAQLDRLLESPSTPEALGSVAFPRLEALLAAAAAVEAGPQPGEHAVLASFRELVAEPAGVTSLTARRRSTLSRQRMYALVAATSGVVLLGSGVAAAAGSLPDAAQSTAKSMLGALGVHVPGPNSNAGTHPNQRGSSGDHANPPSPSSPQATAPVHPTTPANTGTPPTPVNSGVSRHHGNPTPTASGHPTPGHGKPTAAPTVSHRHPAPTHPGVPSTAVMRRFRPSISR
jgi:hypothetical protein